MSIGNHFILKQISYDDKVEVSYILNPNDITVKLEPDNVTINNITSIISFYEFEYEKKDILDLYMKLKNILVLGSISKIIKIKKKKKITN